MDDQRIQRRLAAILAADVVGYSRLMGADETGTLRALNQLRRDFVNPIITRRGGRIVKLMGDGALVEFASVVDAVECAVAIQEGMVERNVGVPDDRRIMLRIGINVGDIIIDGDDIHGDGVNVAARLEALAEPGGISVSRAAYEQVRDKLAYPFIDCGEQTLKNISRPIHVYRFTREGVRPPVPMPQAGAERHGIADAARTAGQAVSKMIGWLKTPPASVTASPVSADEPPALDPPRLSIAVLPFRNLDGDASRDYFADALTEDITADLSRIAGSFVISRATAATYRGRDADAREIAGELKVRYLLEGTVRPAGGNVRVGVQLTDGETGQQIWSDRYEKTVDDMYTFQDEVTGRVARSLNLELKDAMSRRAAGQRSGRGDGGTHDSMDLAMRAWAEIWNKPQTEGTNNTGLDYVRRALALDPENAEALGVATYAYARAANYGWGMSRREAIRKGTDAGEQSIALDPKNADAVFALGFIAYTAGETGRSLELMRQCIELNRNHAPAYFFSGTNLIRLGKPREAIHWVERAFALSPRDPLRSVWYAAIGRAQVILGDDADAVETAGKGIAANSDHAHNYAVLAAARAHLGEGDAARKALEDLKRVMPDITAGRYLEIVASNDAGALESYRRLVEGLQKAGLAD